MKCCSHTLVKTSDTVYLTCCTLVIMNMAVLYCFIKHITYCRKELVLRRDNSTIRMSAFFHLATVISNRFNHQSVVQCWDNYNNNNNKKPNLCALLRFLFLCKNKSYIHQHSQIFLICALLLALPTSCQTCQQRSVSGCQTVFTLHVQDPVFVKWISFLASSFTAVIESTACSAPQSHPSPFCLFFSLMKKRVQRW